MSFKGSQALGLADSDWAAGITLLCWGAGTVVLCILCNRLFRGRSITKWVLAVSFGSLLIFGASTDWANHWFEMHVVRSKIVHGFFQTSKNRTKVPHHPYLIVHQQIPRTGGDSMRTHLFNDVDLELIPLWLSDLKAPPQPWTSGWNESLQATVEQSGKLIKGYLSSADIKRIRRPVKRFVFLREPVERALSFYNYVVDKNTPAAEYFNVSSSYHADGRQDLHMRSYVADAAVWQLGHHMHAHHRNISAADAYDNARLWLETADFVGFYENFASDFLRLRRTLFADVEVPWTFPFFFWLGTALGLPRLRVRRLSARTTPEVIALVEAVNVWDIRLYRWARQHFQQRYTLYDSYGEFVASNWVLLLVAFIALSGV